MDTAVAATGCRRPCSTAATGPSDRDLQCYQVVEPRSSRERVTCNGGNSCDCRKWNRQGDTFLYILLPFVGSWRFPWDSQHSVLRCRSEPVPGRISCIGQLISRHHFALVLAKNTPLELSVAQGLRARAC